MRRISPSASLGASGPCVSDFNATKPRLFGSTSVASVPPQERPQLLDRPSVEHGVGFDPGAAGHLDTPEKVAEPRDGMRVGGYHQPRPAFGGESGLRVV